MPNKPLLSIYPNDGGAEGSTWLLSTQLSVWKTGFVWLQAKKWLTNSRVSAYFQRLDGLRWTPYLDECVAVLTESKEQPTDALLIHLVRLQLMVEKAGQVLGPEEHGDATGSARAPPNFYLNALQSQFQDFKAKIPPDIQNESKRIRSIV